MNEIMLPFMKMWNFGYLDILDALQDWHEIWRLHTSIIEDEIGSGLIKIADISFKPDLT
jgi:hypothetical protein